VRARRAARLRHLAAEDTELALRVRCGLAHGPLVASGQDLYGLDQSLAARVCALAGAGDVFATAPVVADLPVDVGVESIGHRVLAGVPGEVEVFRLRDR